MPKDVKRDTVDLNKIEQEMFQAIMKYSGSRQRIDLYRELIRRRYDEIKKEKKG